MKIEDVEMRLISYVPNDKTKEKARELIKWFEDKGCLIINVDNIAIRYIDRNMNKRSYPLILLE